MLKHRRAFLCLFCLSSSLALAGEETAKPQDVRTIHLRQDDAQIHFASSVYELKNVTAQEIYPFVLAAVKRYNVNSTVRRVNAGTDDRTLLVSTGEKFLPCVNEIIKALDKPGLGRNNSITGTGRTRIAYAPRYRAAAQFSSIIDAAIGASVGRTYVNMENNTIFWSDQRAAAENTLSWLFKLDRPLPQVSIRLNYYELRDSDLKDWGLDYLAWKNGPGVNLLNAGYNAGHLAVNEMIQSVAYAASSSWGFGGFFTAPQFDMSFVRCLQQSGNASITGSASLTMLNTPVATEDEYIALLQNQLNRPKKSTSIYSVSMYPEYQNIAKNTLGRSFIGKSFTTDSEGEKHADPPAFEISILNPFVCFQIREQDEDARGFIPSNPEFYVLPDKDPESGGVIFDYSLYFKNVVERGNTGSELSNSSIFTGAATLGFGMEKVLAVYEKENDVEQTIGLPVLTRIPIIKYLFGTVTTIKERTHIIVTAEAELIHPDMTGPRDQISRSNQIRRRIENPFKSETK